MRGLKRVKKALILQGTLALTVLFSTQLCIASDSIPTEEKPEATSTNDNSHKETTGFKAGELIMHHIGDAHDWHIIDWDGHPVSVPLPVILLDQNEGKGLTIFSSSNFHHGETDYMGYRLSHEHIYAIDENGNIDEAATSNIIDFSMTKNVCALLFSVILMLWLLLSVANTYKKREGKAPSGFQSFIEPIIVFVRDDIAKASIGEKKYEKFMPFLLTVFFFIWINNILGLIPIIPGGANVTGNIAIPLVLATFTFIITQINGGKHYWRHIFAMPGVPVAVLPLITVLEVAGIFIKPITLIIRLFANITAGHIAMLVFFCLIFIAGDGGNVGAGLGVSIGSVLFTIFLNCLELLVGAIQAYVFTLLSAIYFGMAVADDHH